MVAIKRAKSGRSLIFIDDSGRTYVTSIAHIRKLCDGLIKCEFLVLTQMPGLVNPKRFPPSPVWNPNTGVTVPVLDLFSEVDTSSVTNANDVFSDRSTKKLDEVPIRDVML
jgi:hypothetical protein